MCDCKDLWEATRQLVKLGEAEDIFEMELQEPFQCQHSRTLTTT